MPASPGSCSEVDVDGAFEICKAQVKPMSKNLNLGSRRYALYLVELKYGFRDKASGIFYIELFSQVRMF